MERSLRRLGTDRIDLYLLHNWDPDSPLDETLRAMDDLVREGKVLYVGACNFTAAQTVEGLWTADRLGLDPFACLQNEYNLLHRREMEAELLPLVRRRGLGMMTYSPLAVGLLSGRYRRGEPPPPGSYWGGRKDFDQIMSGPVDGVVRTLIEIGSRHGRTPAQVALAWLLDHPEVTAPMIGPDLPEHVDETFEAVGWRLLAEDRETLDAATEAKPARLYP